jgi:hypothetical protein
MKKTISNTTKKLELSVFFKNELKITQCKWFLDKTTIEGPKQRYKNTKG